MSGFSGLYIGLSALRSQQIVQETVAQNIANVNTEGYSRRIATLAPIAAPPTARGIQTGMGVEVTDVRRSASLMLNQQIQEEKGVRAYWETTTEGMIRLEGLYQEPGDNGMAALLDEFWSSWQDLSLDPSSTGARTNVQQRGQILVDTIRRTHTGILDFTTSLNTDLRVQVSRVNVLADEIAGLNRQITQALGSGVTPNDLWDRRDTLLEELSTLSHAQTAENADGSTMVFLEGHMLVGSQGSIPLEVQIAGDGNPQPVWSDDGKVAAISAGEMGATLGLREWALNDVLPKLNEIAAELISAVNTLHSSGVTLDNNPGGDFFSGSNAHDINLSAAVAGDLNAIVTAAAVDSPGDGSIALQIADLQDEQRAALGASINGAYATYVALVGLNVQESETMAGNQEALVDFLSAQRESLAGVSLDEEGITMIGAQRAYEAAARVITVVDEMLDQLINRTGVVGR